MRYNFARPPQTLTKAAGGYPTTPGMAVGVADHVWSLTEIATLLNYGRAHAEEPPLLWR